MLTEVILHLGLHSGEEQAEIYFWLFFLYVLYIVPTLMALVRGSRELTSVLLLNLCLGWTVVGWVAALRRSLR